MASSSFLQSLSSLTSGSAAALALALLAALLLAAFFCYRRRNPNPNPKPNPNPNPIPNPNPNPNFNPNASNSGIVVPRVIFVADEDDGGGGSGRSPTRGLDQAAINSYPKFPYSGGGGSGDNVCSVCLCEYREGEMLRMMPDCRHYFHLLCIDAWLRLNASCPVCRTSPMPTPLSTPLSEVVPLSQFAADRRRR